MHEATLVKPLIAKIQQTAIENHAEKIRRVKVKLGALCHCSPEHFREHFEEGAKGTLVEGAQLEIEVLESWNNPDAEEVILDSVEIES